MTNHVACYRCGRRDPVETRFWALSGMGVLCDSCNAEWAAFRYLAAEAMADWAGWIERRVSTRLRTR